MTIVRDGLIDHSDSLGATARFGRGDVQWLTAGRGIVHSEMFPLLERDRANPLELFQIWLNLPRADKMVEPHFTMLWRETHPDGCRARRRRARHRGHRRRRAARRRRVVTEPPSPPPSSWASRADADVAIWTIKMEPGARWTLPPAAAGTNRTLYFFRGSALTVGGRAIAPYHAVDAAPRRRGAARERARRGRAAAAAGPAHRRAGAAYGPFVMNTRAEIQQAFPDYQRTRFGGWPWPRTIRCTRASRPRFARHADGRIEEPSATRSRR